MTEVTITQEARVEAMHFDWCDATDTEIIAEVSRLEPLVSPNRNACLIQEMRRRFEVRTLTPAQAAGPVLLVTPETVHASHDVREEGEYISDPRCQKCRVSAVDDDRERLLSECEPNRQRRIQSISTAMVSIVDERIRQIEVEGWTPEHDDEHNDESLARAAACYAVGEMLADASTGGTVWPWSEEWWKPTWPTDRRRELVKAGALIVAEIERLDRAAITQAEGPQA